MKIFSQHNPNENGTASVQNLISLLNAPVTRSSIRHIRSNSDYPSLQAISDSLSEWNIENMGVSLTLEQLKEIPYPSLAHLHKNKGHFVVLTKATDNSIQYIDPEIGLINEPLDAFGKRWTGVALLVSANEKSGEVGYKEKRRTEIFAQVSSWISIILLSILLTLPLFYLPLPVFPLYILKIVGGATCLFLLQKQFGFSNSYVDSLCKISKLSDCDTLLRSQASTLFGVIHLSELGILYFAGSLLTLLIAAFASVSVSGLLFVLTLLSLPFTFYSVYYQWRIAKTWCPLCLAVMAIFWAELGSFLLLKTISFSFQSMEVAFIGYSLPLLFWLSVRTRFMDSFKLSHHEKALNRFVKSERIFQALLENKPSVDMGHFEHEISVGNENAPVVITIVSNPICGPCALAHAVIENLLEGHESKLRIRFRFLFNSENEESVPYQVVSHLIALSLTTTHKEFLKALSEWYMKDDEKSFSTWIINNPIGIKPPQELIKNLIEEKILWSRNAGVNVTPTFFINNKKAPAEFSLKDLKYQILKFIE